MQLLRKLLYRQQRTQLLQTNKAITARLFSACSFTLEFQRFLGIPYGYIFEFQVLHKTNNEAGAVNAIDKEPFTLICCKSVSRCLVLHCQSLTAYRAVVLGCHVNLVESLLCPNNPMRWEERNRPLQPKSTVLKEDSLNTRFSQSSLSTHGPQRRSRRPPYLT